LKPSHNNMLNARKFLKNGVSVVAWQQIGLTLSRKSIEMRNIYSFINFTKVLNCSALSVIPALRAALAAATNQLASSNLPAFS